MYDSIVIFSSAVLLGCLYLRHVKESRFFAIFGVLTTMIVGIILIALTAQVEPLANEVRQHQWVQLSSIASGAALIGFSFGGNAVFPQIESGMQHPQRFTAALTLATLLAILFYLPVAIAGYTIFGATVQDMFQSLASVYSTNAHPVQTGAMVASMLLLLGHLWMTFPIIFSALAMQIEGQCKPVVDVTVGRGEGVSFVSTFSRRLGYASIRPAIWALVTLMAVLVPHFLELLVVVSAVTNTLIVMVCPVVLYVVLQRRVGGRIPWWEYVVCAIVLIVACIIGGVATKEGIESLHHIMKKSGS